MENFNVPEMDMTHRQESMDLRDEVDRQAVIDKVAKAIMRRQYPSYRGEPTHGQCDLAADVLDALSRDDLLALLGAEQVGWWDGVLRNSVHENERLRKLLAAGLLAFDLTRQYVGYEVLPAVDGWAWFDWAQRAQSALSGREVQSDD